MSAVHFGWRWSGRRVAGELLDHAAGDGGVEQGRAGSHHTDRLHQVLRGCVLEQEAAGAGTERIVNMGVDVEGGQHHHPGGSEPALQQLPGGGDAVEAGHPHVHQGDVGSEPTRRGDRLDTVGGFAGDRDVGLGGQDEPEPGTDHRLVVGEQD